MAARPAILGLKYLFSLFDLRFGLDNGAGCRVVLDVSCGMMDIGYPFGHGMLSTHEYGIAVCYLFSHLARNTNALTHCLVGIKLPLDYGVDVFT